MILEGGKVMRIVGALRPRRRTISCMPDPRRPHALDLSEVTRIDAEGVSSAILPWPSYGVRVDKRSECVRLAWQTPEFP